MLETNSSDAWPFLFFCFSVCMLARFCFCCAEKFRRNEKLWDLTTNGTQASPGKLGVLCPRCSPFVNHTLFPLTVHHSESSCSGRCREQPTVAQPELYSKFPLAIYFTYGNVSFHVTLSTHLTLSSTLPMSISLFSMSVSPLLPCK